MGVDARVAVRETRGAAPGPGPCFNEPWVGELTLGGRKLAGSAQWRSNGAILQHGSVLVEDDQSTLTRLWIESRPTIPAPATLTAALGRTPSPDELYQALSAAVRDIEDPCAEPLRADASLRAHAASLVVHYADDAWTWYR
jgi:lipoate-protein ligase A